MAYGQRCIWMRAHKTVLGSDGSMFYQCPVMIDPVHSILGEGLQEAHKVSDSIARLAASSIGLQGGKSDPGNGWTQFQFYPISQLHPNLSPHIPERKTRILTFRAPEMRGISTEKVWTKLAAWRQHC